MAVRTLLYGIETWIPGKKGLQFQNDCEMTSVKGYTKLDQLCSDNIRYELNVSEQIRGETQK